MEAADELCSWRDRLLSKQEVAGIIGLCSKSIDRGIGEAFPEPISVKGRPRWKGWEVWKWLNKSKETHS